MALIIAPALILLELAVFARPADGRRENVVVVKGNSMPVQAVQRRGYFITLDCANAERPAKLRKVAGARYAAA